MYQLQPEVINASTELRSQFRSAQPFRYLQIDDFFTASFAEQLLSEFPSFERGNARNEQGELGGKSVVEKIRELGPAFQSLDDLVQSAAFLNWLSQATGIPKLCYDPWYFGGGTHDNRHGQELDPHVDFNRHPENGSHRRLNLIVYMNPDWDDAWGGALELHSDPRSADDQVRLIGPAFNRCVVFETTENSWHGFSKIHLPEARRDLSRRSIALYFYTADRPTEELAPTHSTIYVDRPLPAEFRPGHKLSQLDVQTLELLLARRDQHIQRLYSELMHMQAQLDTAQQGLAQKLFRWSAHGKRLGLGMIDLAGSLLRDKQPLRQSIRDSLHPFYAALPPPHRRRLKALWQRHGKGTGLAPAGPAPLPIKISPAAAPSSELTSASERERDAPAVDAEQAAYAARIAKENQIFESQVNVHDLPEIFHYWSNTYLLPMELEFGFRHPEDFFAKFLLEAAQRDAARPARFVSLGCGNCDAEVRIASDLISRGLSDFVLECVDINPTMLERGRQLAREAGVEAQVKPVLGDFNAWQPQGQYQAVMANQSLHHVLKLEALFDAVQAALAPQGLFIASDMIGRNGHQRWPEAKAIIDEFWKELPDTYRFNLQLQRREKKFLDWDCSVEGFEGVRAQDILPLLIERFGFELFLGFGNLIDPFIDRGFGHHFSSERDWDRDFIDRVHARDEAELQAGSIKPTHMLAVMVRDRDCSTRYRDGLSPRHCLRTP